MTIINICGVICNCHENKQQIWYLVQRWYIIMYKKMGNQNSGLD